MHGIPTRTITAVILATICVAAASCAKLPAQDPALAGDLVPLTELPAAWGELVSVTFAPQADNATAWREMWFANEETGTVTYVPVRLPEWKYYPKMVRTIAGSAASAVGGGS